MHPPAQHPRICPLGSVRGALVWKQKAWSAVPEIPHRGQGSQCCTGPWDWEGFDASASLPFRGPRKPQWIPISPYSSLVLPLCFWLHCLSPRGSVHSWSHRRAGRAQEAASVSLRSLLVLSSNFSSSAGGVRVRGKAAVRLPCG